MVAQVPNPEAPPEHPWHRVDELVEPERARQLIDLGTGWLVQWCRFPPKLERADPSLLTEILHKTAGKRTVRKYSGRRTIPTVFVAEEWKKDDGTRALIFVEGPPAPGPDPGAADLPL